MSFSSKDMMTFSDVVTPNDRKDFVNQVSKQLEKLKETRKRQVANEVEAYIKEFELNVKPYLKH